MTTLQTYTIMQAAKLSGLPESTLRYYETIGLIDPIQRGPSSKQREYAENDLDMIIAVACLSATGMSIENMRTYLNNRSRGAHTAKEQIGLLAKQRTRLLEEAHFIQLRQRYVDAKIECWQAIEAGDDQRIEATKEIALSIASELKLPREEQIYGGIMKQKITFKRDGLTLAGNLFTPENFDENGHYNAVIVQGSFTLVKEQMPETYAQKFADEGFVALVFDYSHYGESEGTPRQLESSAEKLNDLKAAVTYLTDLSYIQAVSMVGVCTSAGLTAYLTADDKRIKSVATVAAFLPSPAMFGLMLGENGIAQRLEAGAAAKLKYEETVEETTIPAYSETDQNAVNFGPAGSFDYYLNEKRGNVPNYKNEFNVMA